MQSSFLTVTLLFFRFESRRLVCLYPEQDLGLCRGDSGGALVCNKKVVGVAHMLTNKDRCTNDVECGRLDTITFYMYVCPYLDWMRKSVPSIPPKPLSCKASPLPSTTICPLVLLSLTVST